jgi:hypothetical protein
MLVDDGDPVRGVLLAVVVSLPFWVGLVWWMVRGSR